MQWQHKCVIDGNKMVEKGERCSACGASESDLPAFEKFVQKVLTADLDILDHPLPHHPQKSSPKNKQEDG